MKLVVIWFRCASEVNRMCIGCGERGCYTMYIVAKRYTVKKNLHQLTRTMLEGSSEACPAHVALWAAVIHRNNCSTMEPSLL